ncbi:MAG: RNA-binding protein hfq [Limnothrix sp.]|uniref:Hfq-related RNA-binding protein n=1 Tax=unclassified Limnothrix TaxID=2632864 RepID=UPI00081E6F4E|nr:MULTISPECIES: RNA-binding protein hfq [unclassified Limnothrix]MEB3119043.1 RNA-binding protein hfq [Limnothrix sp.]OCQ90791.1 RNA-binding protein hfq [Limnothrix sp. P13C2]RFP59262.1 MAG: RNA-binding protein hfq [Limnothrix sp. CACIAM 69d]MBD2159282.1 RNA-binding protein hfq [Limnothrix sp. FACHB-1083]MBD2191987.1 RNA-binding protein hfq [Limnothrix sp. FACHB-1088]
MAEEFNTGLPSTRQVQTAIKNKQEVELKLLTNDLIAGKVRWQDSDCICIVDHYDQPTIVWRHAIAYLKPKA